MTYDCVLLCSFNSLESFVCIDVPSFMPLHENCILICIQKHSVPSKRNPDRFVLCITEASNFLSRMGWKLPNEMMELLGTYSQLETHNIHDVVGISYMEASSTQCRTLLYKQKSENMQKTCFMVYRRSRCFHLSWISMVEYRNYCSRYILS
jgi:hypothetical protein